MENLIKKTKKLIEKVPYINVASITPEGNPWSSPIFAAYDNDYNFFFNSSPLSEHSKNIAYNNKVFLTIFDTSVSEGTGFGVYMKAIVNELSEGEELEHALAVFYAKKAKDPKPQEKFLGLSSQRFYKVTPIKCWVNMYDKTHSPVDWREEINLK